MKRKGQVNGILAMSIGLILGVVILAVVFAFVSEQTSTASDTITDDQFTASNATCVRITSNCINSLTNIQNATGAGVVATSNYSLCPSAISAGNNGVLLDGGDALANTQQNGVTMNATYTEQNCDFITSGTTRTLINLIPLLLAIAALIFAVGFIALKR